MSMFHIHIGVKDLRDSIDYYSAVFGAPPTAVQDDYAKWQLEDPKINFAISTRARVHGVDHVGIQADNAEELKAIESRLEQAGIEGLAQADTSCCYARSDKYWSMDPQGIAWEAFHTLGDAPVFSASTDEAQAGSACCTPKLTRCC